MRLRAGAPPPAQPPRFAAERRRARRARKTLTRTPRWDRPAHSAYNHRVVVQAADCSNGGCALHWGRLAQYGTPQSPGVCGAQGRTRQPVTRQGTAGCGLGSRPGKRLRRLTKPVRTAFRVIHMLQAKDGPKKKRWGLKGTKKFKEW